MKKGALLLALASVTVSTMADESVAPVGLGTVLQVGTYFSPDKSIKAVQLVTWKRRNGVVCHQNVSGVATLQTANGTTRAFVTDTSCSDDLASK